MNCHSTYSSLLTHLLSSGCGELFPSQTFKLCICHLVSELPQLHMFFQCLLNFLPCHVFFFLLCVTPMLTCFFPSRSSILDYSFSFCIQNLLWNPSFILETCLQHLLVLLSFAFILSSLVFPPVHSKDSSLLPLVYQCLPWSLFMFILCVLIQACVNFK